VKLEREKLKMAPENSPLGSVRKLPGDFSFIPLHFIDDKNSCSCGIDVCDFPGVHPVTDEAAYYPSNRLDDITRWFSPPSEYNIGVATGREAGIIAVVFYMSEEYRRVLDINSLSPIWNTVAIGSRHYLQLIFEYPDDISVPSLNRIEGFPNMKIMGDGGYIAVPPGKIGSKVFPIESNTPLDEIKARAAVCPSEIKQLIETNRQNRVKFRYGKSNKDKVEVAEYMIRFYLHLKKLEMDRDNIRRLCEDRVRSFQHEITYVDIERMARIYSASKSTAVFIPDVFTEMKFAEFLTCSYSHHFKYCIEEGKFIKFRPDRWILDDGEGYMYEMYKIMLQRINHLVIDTISDPELRMKKLSALLKMENNRKFRDIMEIYRSDIRNQISTEDIDRDPGLINFTNCTFDLRSQLSYPNFRWDYLMNSTGYEYDTDASCPQFEKAILSTIGNRENVRFVQKYLGYAITGNTSMDAMLILVGETGTGKSTLLEVIEHVFGTYCVVTPVDTFLSKRRNAIPNDVARLKGKRLVIANEMSEEHRFSVDRIKTMTGGDTISARKLYQEWFQFQPTHKIILATNHLPKVEGFDNALTRRFRIVECNQGVPVKERIPDFPEVLKREAAGIMNWILEGYRMLCEEGLEPTDSMRKTVLQYRIEEDRVLRFINECCKRTESEIVGVTQLYTTYDAFMKNRGERRTDTLNMFSRKLLKHGFRKIRRSVGMYFEGIEIKKEIQTELHDKIGSISY